MNAYSYDIIIVGGGIIGLSLACALAHQTNLSIAVLEAQPSCASPWSALQYGHRVSAIALSAQRIFQNLGVWENILKKRVQAFAKMEVWDAQSTGQIQFNSKEVAEPILGYIIENNVIQSSLEEKIKQCTQVKLFSSVILKTYEEKIDKIELGDENGQLYNARLAIAADGANSWLRSAAGIDLNRCDYAQEAIVAIVKTKVSHQNIARQVFLDTGPLAFLPLNNEHLSSIVWSLPTKESKRVMQLHKNDFKNELAYAFCHRLGEIIDVEQPYSFKLYKQQVKAYVKSHVALVGDAAHTIHPLAGQGVNMGLLDAASLAEVIAEAIKSHRDFVNKMILRRYERWRKADNFSLLMGVDMLKKLFASNSKNLQQLRSYGLNTTNHIQWIKNIFIRYAIGNRSGLPEIART